ncbi:hypothetical protein GUITHDRAFT_118889 [Guillardia theta CCMP2712]|uniref:Uncharacterized protein n=1 Tax=Guillardia theta (strain CCMP2712) TaxID=905079 RepID=L1IFE5_GUITC|nr:hypothetical protein GUITHDRAFT_118889 [Guillardia theta CCMP2712]EKX34958.1 hypothetical protein GUITHDRAFT_118889 [Guillardia theta CCMP2712]|eukprot:XP_005821938.1 hypothetical protein GUITHDRAFT_118889 [Guillardia theta CCMP2712]
MAAAAAASVNARNKRLSALRAVDDWKGLYRSHPYDEESPNTACLIFMLMIGFSMVVYGVHVWFQSYIDTRSFVVKEFNWALGNWTKKFEPVMKKSTASITINGTSSSMSMDNTSEFPKKWQTEFALLWEWITVGVNQKMCRVQSHGVWERGSCWSLRRLTSVCLTLELKEAGNEQQWVLPARQVSQCGCSKDGPLVYAKEFSRRLPNSNRRLSSQDLSPTRGNFSSPFVVQFALRYKEDPFLSASKLSNGQFTFGPTPHQNFLESIVMMALGGIIILPASVALIALSCGCSPDKSRSSRQRKPSAETRRPQRYTRLAEEEERTEHRVMIGDANSQTVRRRGRSKDNVEMKPLLQQQQEEEKADQAHETQEVRIDIKESSNT